MEYILKGIVVTLFIGLFLFELFMVIAFGLILSIPVEELCFPRGLETAMVIMVGLTLYHWYDMVSIMIKENGL